MSIFERFRKKKLDNGFFYVQDLQSILSILEPIMSREREKVYKQLRVYASWDTSTSLKYVIPTVESLGLTVMNALVRDESEKNPIGIPSFQDVIEKERRLLGLASLTAICLPTGEKAKVLFEDSDFLATTVAPLLGEMFQRIEGNDLIEVDLPSLSDELDSPTEGV